MALSIGGMLATIFLVIIMTFSLGMNLNSFTSPQFAANVSQTTGAVGGQLSSGILSPINSTSYNKSGGFYSAIQSNVGYAFQFPGIGPVMSALTNGPHIIVELVSNTFVAMAKLDPSGTLALIFILVSGLIASFLLLYVTVAGISVYSKANWLWAPLFGY